MCRDGCSPTETRANRLLDGHNVQSNGGFAILRLPTVSRLFSEEVGLTGRVRVFGGLVSKSKGFGVGVEVDDLAGSDPALAFLPEGWFQQGSVVA